MRAIVDAWKRLPTWAKWAVGLGAVGGGAMLLKGKKTVSVPAPADLAKQVGVTPAKARIIAWMVDEWRRDGRLTADEQAALLAVALKEGAFNLNAISPAGAPDDKGGKAWGTFQFLAVTLKGLGFTIENVSPKKGPDGKVSEAELERAARGSARVALAFLFKQKAAWTGGRPYLEAVRAMHAGDPFKVARDIFTAWNAGPGRRWADIEKHRPTTTPGPLGYVHYTVAGKLKALPAFRAALGLPPITITTTV